MRRAGLSLITVGLLAVALAYGLVLAGAGATAAPWAMAGGTTAVLAGLAALGSARHRRSTPILTVAVTAAFASVALGFALPLAMPAPAAGEALLLGLPRPTALLLLFVHAVPLVLLPAAYALAFEREVLGDADLAGVGTAAATRRPDGEPARR